MKKNLAPAGDDEGRMMPGFKDAYCPIAWVFGAEREYNLPLAKKGRRTRPQSYKRYRGSKVALA